ncbi:uncharacterized protein SCHCODRAFT_02748275 [Schizophyllum commune H4-8]|uniref:uncharacterized protein n=1 Tax=Schizophyllum commune (strain H4-8 / FGSC 9210) TaxID=578458 RepID=UPI00215E1518|nr:uncharacterized protein SCHCODRAFT_02748275 [Schizophyllum commune H4-8]KAI5891878.1 hypothetical protein SCHCODRAFT_02748275 [Schizophyllum commune H4-8]
MEEVDALSMDEALGVDEVNALSTDEVDGRASAFLGFADHLVSEHSLHSGYKLPTSEAASRQRQRRTRIRTFTVTDRLREPSPHSEGDGSHRTSGRRTASIESDRPSALTTADRPSASTNLRFACSLALVADRPSCRAARPPKRDARHARGLSLAIDAS